MQWFKILLLILCIPLGCNMQRTPQQAISKQNFSYDAIGKLVEEIETNKDILARVMGINQLNLQGADSLNFVSTAQVLQAYKNQLNELINAFRNVTFQTRKNYFDQLKVSINIARTTKSNITLVKKGSDELKITMGLQVNQHQNQGMIETLSQQRLYKFFVKNLKAF